MGRHRNYLIDNIQEWHDRYQARATILAAANVNRVFPTNPYYFPRHIQRAASVCRRRRLVHPDILVMAGFRGYPL